MSILNDISSFLLTIVKIITPIVIVILAFIIIANMYKWATNLQDAVITVFKSPLRVIYVIVLIGGGFYIYFKHIMPLLDRVDINTAVYLLLA